MNDYSSVYDILEVRVGAVPGGFTPMYMRPYAINASERDIDSLLENTKNGTVINDSTINSSDVISLSTETSKAIEISGGWDSERALILFKVRNRSTGSLYLVTAWGAPDLMIQGPSGITFNDRAAITFDSYSEFAETQGATGVVRYPVATDGLVGRVNTEFDPQASGYGLMVRPMEVIENAAVKLGFGGDTNEPIYGGSSGAAGMSRDVNNIASSWFGRTLSALSSGATSENYEAGGQSFGAVDPEHLLNSALTRNQVSENTIRRSNVIAEILSSAHQRREVSITWGEFKQSWVGIERMIQPPQPAGKPPQVPLSAWNDVNASRIVAEFGVAVRGLIKHLGIAQVEFFITNQQQDSMSGRPNVFRLSNENMFTLIEDLDPGTLTVLENRIRDDIFPRICQGSLVSIQCKCSVLSEMNISLGYEGMERAYKAPTWSSSLWSPVMASTGQQGQLTGAMSYLATKMSDAYNGVRPGMQSADNAIGGSFGNFGGGNVDVDNLFG